MGEGRERRGRREGERVAKGKECSTSSAKSSAHTGIQFLKQLSTPLGPGPGTHPHSALHYPEQAGQGRAGREGGRESL